MSVQCCCYYKLVKCEFTLLHGTKCSHGSILYNPQKITNTTEKSQYTFADSCIVVYYVILLVSLYFAGIGMPNKIDGKHATGNCRKALSSHFDANII